MSAVTLLQVEPTTRCNFTCGFCVGRHLDQSDLDPADFDRVLAAFPHVEQLELQGEGEPLLHPGFFEMARRASERGIRVSSVTNGSLFTPRNIEHLLEAGVSALLVSIESPDPDEFRRIRGGRLEKVVDGIRALLAARRRADRRTPSVGFAVTVLKGTARRIGEIVDLYDSLGMDGGILVHMLSSMDSYARHYDGETADQVLPKMAQTLTWARCERLVERRGRRDGATPHFWTDLYTGRASATGRGLHAVLPRCPWLERGLYVDRHGAYVACPNIKDAKRHALGHVGDRPDEVLRARQGMADQLKTGHVPQACRGCFIADTVAGRAPRQRQAPEARDEGGRHG
jgi:MoaA/NifB/PqqE/SkfB family radical SAM enzyme